MANIFHSVSSTFPTWACGEQARGCAIRVLERFVYGSEHPHDDHEKDDSERRMRECIHRHEDLDFGSLIGAKHGFRTRELVPGSGGLGGVVVWPYDDEEEDERKTTKEEIVDELELLCEFFIFFLLAGTHIQCSTIPTQVLPPPPIAQARAASTCPWGDHLIHRSTFDRRAG
ncbi:hypothetical protein H0H87_012011 [Tephrocybe sp. NHM501043]|nr:hypothetical protein H0H87_012011 [Tephrocybe sp. NHM501043]